MFAWRSTAAAMMLFCFLTAVRGDDKENSYRNAKVGDWAEYMMTGPSVEGSTKMTVVAKDDKELTYEITSTFSFMGNKTVAPVQTMKVDLTKPYDTISAANLKSRNVKIEKLEEGKEKLKAAGKEYDTNWTKLRSTATANGMTIVSDYQMWFCQSVALGGLVRMDTTTGAVTTRVELIGSARK
jgi:hypothetical protein